MARAAQDIVVKDTHRGLWYEDGVLRRVVEAGRYRVPGEWPLFEALLGWTGWRAQRVELVLVDVRQRELTIKGQEILTADKVAVRVSIIVQFRVEDARAAVHAVAAERTAEAQLVEARTRAQGQRIEARAKAEVRKVEAEAQAEAARLAAVAEAEALRIRSQAAADALEQSRAAGEVYGANPALLRLRELEAVAELAKNANARIYFGVEPRDD